MTPRSSQSARALLTALLCGGLLGGPVPAALASAPTGSSGTSGATILYTVQPGDTLYHIAAERGLNLDELRRLNGLTSDDISVGQQLRLPRAGGAPLVTPARTPSVPVSSGTVPLNQGPLNQGPPNRGPVTVPGSARPGSTGPGSTGIPRATAPSAPAAQSGASVPPSGPSTSAPVSGPVPTGGALAGVSVRAPATLRMGDAFVLRLSGARASRARVSFPSEVGEDVRRPDELLTPIGAAGEYVVLGRVVLGKTTPLVYEVQVDGQQLRGSIPVTGLDQPIQHLNLPKATTDLLQDPGRAAEDAAVEKAYLLRTPQAWSRPFAAPLASSSVSSSFGQPRTYLAGGKVSYHYGTDYPAPVGTPVRAVNDGTVVIAGRYPVRGNLVAIDHGAGLVSLYFHQSRLLVKVGQKVRRGDVIGQVGTTGLSAGPHLHLELRVRGEATLPTEYFGKLWP